MSVIASIALLGGIGAAGALALNGVAAKFRVDEDERVKLVEEALPGANCGGCGFKGCHDFAVHYVEDGASGQMSCPVAGPDGMARVAAIIGAKAQVARKVAVVRCAGTDKTKARLYVKYSGPRVCAVMNMAAGEYVCQNSCLGCADCVEACSFAAISMPKGASTPVVDPEACTGCGSCAIACPRDVIKVRSVGPRGRMVWVACGNCSRGPEARKQCKVACIGCGLCAKVCTFGAIEVKDGLATVDADKCKTCGKCVTACPTGAMQCNFEVKTPKADADK